MRTNIVDVFDAVAIHNPIAPCLLDEVGWHQLVLKALFLGRPLFRIHDLDARRTPDLARAALDYARERWAAGRPISPELWRLLAGHADLAPAEDLDRAEASADAADDSLTAEAVRLVREGVTDRLPWDRIGRHWEDAP